MTRSVGGAAGVLARLFIVSLLMLLLAPPLAGLGLGVMQLVGGEFERPELLGYQGVDAGLVTAGWAIGIGAVASLLGLGAGRRLVLRRRPLETTLWTVPILLAPAVLFDAWWLELGPDSMIGEWAAVHDRVPLLRQSTLAIGLITFALPLAVWTHAAGGTHPELTLWRLDRPRGWRRLVAWCRLDGPAVGRVALLVAIVVGGLTVPFDLAQVRSIGFELRTLDTRGGSVGTLLLAGWWSVPIAMAGSVLLTRRCQDRRRGTLAPGSASIHAGLGGVVLGSVLILIPILLLVRRAAEVDLADAWRLHGAAATGTLRMATVGAVLGATMSAGCVFLRGCGGRSARLAVVALGGCCLVAFLPATLVASGVERVWNRPMSADIYDGPIAMSLAVVGRIAIVPAVVGFVLVPRAGMVGGGSPAMDAPRRIGDLVKAMQPTLLRAMMAGGLSAGVLAAGEIPLTARLQPPGSPLLSTALLNAMHYQYVDSILPVVLPVSLAAIPVAMVLTTLVREPRVARISLVMPLLVAVLALSVGCSSSDDGEHAGNGPPPLSFSAIFGRPGNLDGRFDYPRAIAIDPERDRVFIVDKSARIQRFSLDGELESSWRMPRFENGKPTGISIAPDGRVVVADTHEHRITIFSPDGDLLETHGRMGREPGEFIYPTDVVAGPDGRWFVSEYGGNDRVQIFDADWNPIGVIGFAGETDDADRAALSRPQSIAWNARRGELFIADAIHHRIVVTDADGVLRRVLGGPGGEPGRFSYPYGIGIHDDESLLVVEFGGNRVQRIDPDDGRCLAMAGGTGTEPGRLRYPWAIDVAEGRMAILDSGNARVLIGEPPDIGSGISTPPLPGAATALSPEHRGPSES
jgi:DNA-binding beta-propeller fold protein YncE